MSAGDALWTADRGNEEEDKEEEEEEVGIPKDNMFSLESIRWTYTFLPHKFSRPYLHTAEDLPHHMAYSGFSTSTPHKGFSPLPPKGSIYNRQWVYIPRF